MSTLDKVIEVLSDISLIDEVRPEMTLFDLGLGMYERDLVKCILAV